LDRLVRDFGADGDVALLDPDWVSGWFTFVWGTADHVRTLLAPQLDPAEVAATPPVAAGKPASPRYRHRCRRHRPR
jgi:hypothetical protein